MKSLILRFPFRTVTFQTARVGKFGHYKTNHQKAFQKACNVVLMANLREIKEFAKGFDRTHQVISVKCLFLYDNFFTKKDNTISSKTVDADNSPKMTMDLIFNCLQINDSDIAHMEIAKWKDEKDAIVVELKILEREEFEELLINY